MSAPILVLAPLRDGEADSARAAAAALDKPFACVPGTHLARLQILRPPPRRFRGRTRHYVRRPPTTTGPSSRGWRQPRVSGAPVLAHCAFWPGADDPAEVVRWARARELQTGFSVVGSPHASVEEVGEALALRERVVALAARTTVLDDAALQAAWRAW